MRTSEQLTPGAIYSRRDLQRSFMIVDATIRNGVFRPPNSRSIWLFVTAEMEAHQTQYQDRLEGDDLTWDGQMQGRTDRLIADHEVEGLELLVFYRRHKGEHPDFGFRYEGVFRYISHKPGAPAERRPSRFLLRRCLPVASDTPK
jgi:putative restriction endonuclease